MRMKEKTEEDLDEVLLDVGEEVAEPLDVVMDNLLKKSDRKKRRYALG